MRFSYRLVRDARGWVAECVESEAAGEGTSAQEAVASLRRSLEERMFRPDAVAPPSHPTADAIELVLANDQEQELDRGGPGDAP
jgi:hypothetical protein